KSLKISEFFSSTRPLQENKDENNKKIFEAIKFVNEVIHMEQISEAEKARYMVVLYFFQLLLRGKKRIEAANAVAEVVGGGSLESGPISYDESYQIRIFLQLINDEKEYVWVTHDESTFFTYNGTHAMWGLEDEQPLRKKGLGLGIHNDIEEVYATIVLSARHGGYWNTKKLLEQVKRAINIFKRTHPGYIGISWVLRERGLWQKRIVLECTLCKKEPNPRIIDCCACCLMVNQSDFFVQCGEIQQEIESHGHKHKKMVLEAFDSISVERIRSFARLLFRWMDAYKHGLTGKAAEYAVKQYRKHRSINEEIMNQIKKI
ncbi:30376_t:CDS:2, partial [Gigaspora margarita]